MIWDESRVPGPLVAVAIHAGHQVRPEVASLLALDEEERLREEDPFTDLWTRVAPTRLVATHSRFEVDLNRPRERAVYVEPEDAWGLRVWKERPHDDLIERSLQRYDAFYARLGGLLDEAVEEWGGFVLLDLHSYNHRREGPDAPAADSGENPEVNVGTGTMDRARWSGVVDRFLHELRAAEAWGGEADVRENVKFRGGNLSRWVHETWPRTGCALAVELKKTFMDEWTGTADFGRIDVVRRALLATVPGLLEELNRR